MRVFKKVQLIKGEKLLSTISELQTQIEELEKRIKAISNAQTLHSELSALRDYFDTIQDLLEDMAEQIEGGGSASDISALATRVSELESAVQGLTNGSGNVITLQNAVSALQTTVSNIKGGSETSISSLDSDIFSLQTDLGAVQDNIDDIEGDISDINTDLGGVHTTINNLQSTQNTLTTTQTTLTTTVNSLGTRLTTAENNINQLTGGVDLTDFEQRLSACEGVTNNVNFFEFRDIEMGFTPANKICITKDTHYSTNSDCCVKESWQVDYTSTGTGTLQVELYLNDVLTKTYSIDLEKNPSTCMVEYNYRPSTPAQTTRLRIVGSSSITVSAVHLSLFGQNLIVFNSDPDIKVVVYNGYIYITRDYSNCVKIGKFAIADKDTIDIDNLPITVPLQDSYFDGYIYTLFSPIIYGTPVSERIKDDEGLIRITIDGKVQYRSLDMTKSTTFYRALTQNNKLSVPNTVCAQGYYYYGILHTVYAGEPHYIVLQPNALYLYKQNHESFTNDVRNVAPVCTHYLNVDSGSSSYSSAMYSMVLKDDGCYYFSRTPSVFLKIAENCTGNAMCYQQSTYIWYVYIQRGKNLERYHVSYENFRWSTGYDETIYDCDYIWETIGGQVIKHTSNGWVLVTPEV